MRFTSLGSGSSGNALIVESGRTRVMMDCGFTLVETKARLERAGLAPSDIAAGGGTPAHHHPPGGVGPLAQRHPNPGYPPRGPPPRLPPRFSPVVVRCHHFHRPVQFAFSDGAARLGVVTDLGTVTQHVVEKLSGCQALVIECNHDLDMLMTGPYPDGLKHRVSGRFGHLCNLDAGRLVAAVERSHLRHLIAAHLSRQNNNPELAVDALSLAAGCQRECIRL